MMRLITSVIMVCVLLSVEVNATAEQNKHLNDIKPNIVLIMADDVGYSDIGAFGGEIFTPNLDKLAESGMRFSNFHVTPACATTRAALITGVDPHKVGVGSLKEIMPPEHSRFAEYKGELNSSAVSVANLIQKLGYNTYYSGKWHLGISEPNMPSKRGFQRSFIQAHSGSDNYELKAYLPMYDGAYWFEDDQRITEFPENFYSSTVITDKAIEYIQSNDLNSKPFFAFVSYQAAHSPLQAPRKFIQQNQGKYKLGWKAIRAQRYKKTIDLGLMPKSTQLKGSQFANDWDALTEEEKLYEQRRMEAHAGMITAMDYDIGRLISFLKEAGEFDNTVFLFLSDNGPSGTNPYDNLIPRLWLGHHYSRDIDSLGDKGSWIGLGANWASASASPLDLHKFTVGEGGIRTPLIISGIPNQRLKDINHGFSSVLDLAPTMLKLAGIGQKASQLEGKNLLPVLLGQQDQIRQPNEVFAYEFAGSAAVYKNDFKLVKHLNPKLNRDWQLYNLSVDPGEFNNIAASHPKLVAELTLDYDRYRVENRVQLLPDDYDYTKQTIKNAIRNVFWYETLFVLSVLLLALLSLTWWIIKKLKPQNNHRI